MYTSTRSMDFSNGTNSSSGASGTSRTTMSSTTGSFSNQYTFSNLPSFMSNKRRNESNAAAAAAANTSIDHSFVNTTTANIAHKAELPFVPTRKFPMNDEFFRDSRLPPGPGKTSGGGGNATGNGRRVFSPAARDYLFGNRVWSATSDRGRLFSGERNYVKDEGRRSGSGNGEIDEVDPHAEFLKLAKNLGSLVYVVSKKGGMWILWLLNMLFVFLVSKLRAIPNPVYQVEVVDVGNEGGEVVAESTPVKSGLSEPMADEMRNPLFQQKLRDINVSLNEKLQRARDDELDEERTVISRRVGDVYGTRFYGRKSEKEDVVNLEAEFLKTAMKSGGMFNNRGEEDLYSKVKNIKENLANIAQQPMNKVENRVIKPTFTRSTKRFEDLEWLVDDNEDYLNNLESTRLFKEYQNVLNERKKMQQLLHLSKLKETRIVKPLNNSQREEVEDIWEDQRDGVLIKKYGVRIESRDLLTLADRHWLNDNIIDFYLQLVKEYVELNKISKIHVFSTFFYTTLKNKGYEGVRRWAKRAKIDVSELDYIFIPMNLNQTHWALSVIDNINERMIYVDSLYSDGTNDLEMLVDYMKEETRRVHGDAMNGKNYDMYTIDGDFECPNQENGFDCGVFTCTAVDYIARHEKLTYSQNDMSVLRRRMAWEILHGKLTDH